MAGAELAGGSVFELVRVFREGLRAARRTRTDDPHFTRVVLYQLS
jgi:hypothetical protein